MNGLRALWWRVSGSLWFVPALLVLFAVGLAVVLIDAQDAFGDQLARDWPLLLGAGAQGAREMLSAIAGSMITVAGVIFSVTLVALSLAASQYSPRVLRTFMSDRPTQVVLGVFVSVFAYCLVVLRTIRGEDEGTFVPSLAVLGGMALAFVAIGFLVFYIHHLAAAIQVSSIIDRVADTTLKTIDSVLADDCGPTPDGELYGRRKASRIEVWTPVAANKPGYIVSVNLEGLLRYARACERTVRMEHPIGHFLVNGQPIVSLSGQVAVNDADVTQVNKLYSTDSERTIEQDPAFGIQQIVDIAVRALSPGINDETTAIMCIDRLTQILVHLAPRRMGPRCHMKDGRVALLVAAPDFADTLRMCADPIRSCGSDKPRVLVRLVWMLEQTAAALSDAERTAAVKAHLQAIVETAERSIAPHDRVRVVEAARRNGAAA